jgi:hypothetical protein
MRGNGKICMTVTRDSRIAETRIENALGRGQVVGMARKVATRRISAISATLGVLTTLNVGALPYSTYFPPWRTAACCTTIII